MLTRRAALRGLAAFSGAAWLGAACRGGSETRGACPALAGERIRWIVPNAPGGGYDAESRMLQPFLEQRLGATIVIDNQAGAGGIVGTRALAEASPDGRTLGILGVPGLLVATLLGQAAPNPARDFTILGRISRSMHVWAVGASRSLVSLEEMIVAARKRPLVFAINEVGSANFISINATAALLDLPVELVPGFEGTRAACLAAIRGDVDMVCFNFDTVRPLIVAGELRPVLQINSDPIPGDRLLDGVPMLGGPDGLAMRAATSTTGRDRTRSVQLADALARVMGSGRIVVAPRGMPSDLADCLSGVLAATLASEALRTIAGESLAAASAAAAQADAEAAVADAALLLPLIEPALQKLRS